MNPFNDKPIEGPEEDQFDFSTCAKAIAESIFGNKKPEGTVIAIHGPWGSGKSSVINLVKHYLKIEMEKKRKPDQTQKSFEFPRAAPNWIKSLAPKAYSKQTKSFEFPRTAPNWIKSLAPKMCSRQSSDDTSNSVNIPIQILDFKCWWFKGEEALMLEFFRQLYSALDQSGLREAKAAMSQLGSIILSGSAPLVGTIVNSMMVPIVGNAVSNSMNNLSKLIKQERTIENLYEKVLQGLKSKNKRYLMIIDDIDRLSPDEALLIFRLVKSVGQLPKITYLLAYDRKVAEEIVSKRYPSEKSHYLEKIVQAGFDIPYPLRSDLTDTFRKSLGELWKKPENSIYWKKYQDSDYSHFENLFDNVVDPQIQSPRDVIRIMNTLRVTWLAVAGEVDPADFLALETLRVKQPGLYATLKAHKQLLTGMDFSSEDKNSKISRYEDIFVHDLQDEKQRAAMKRALGYLFPPLAAVWAGHDISDDSRKEWQCQRRACSPAHFDTYFRFSLSETISLGKVQAVIKNSGNTDYVKNKFLQESQIPRRNGRGTCANVLLDELKAHAKDIPIQNAKVFLSALFSVYEKLDTEIDLSDNFMIINNDMRIYLLLKNLLLNRTDPDERSTIIVDAIQFANLYLTIFITIRTRLQYYPPPGELSEPENSCLITKSDMEYLCKMSAEKIKTAVENDELLSSRNPLDLLNHWNLLAGSDKSKEAKSWCMSKLNDDNAVEIFAKELTRRITATNAYSENIISYHIQMDMLKKFFDIESFRQRVKLLSESQPENERYVTLKRFLDAFNER